MCTIRFLVRDLSRFFMYALSAFNFPLRTTFIEFYNLGMLCISFYWILGSLQYFSLLMSWCTFVWAQSCSISINLQVFSRFCLSWYPIFIYSDLIGCSDLLYFFFYLVRIALCLCMWPGSFVLYPKSATTYLCLVFVCWVWCRVMTLVSIPSNEGCTVWTAYLS